MDTLINVLCKPYNTLGTRLANARVIEFELLYDAADYLVLMTYIRRAE